MRCSRTRAASAPEHRVAPPPALSANPVECPSAEAGSVIAVEGARVATAAAVEEAGTIRSSELAQRVGARRWGPGRFQNALSATLDEGRIQRVGRAAFAPAERGNSA